MWLLAPLSDQSKIAKRNRDDEKKIAENDAKKQKKQSSHSKIAEPKPLRIEKSTKTKDGNESSLRSFYLLNKLHSKFLMKTCSLGMYTAHNNIRWIFSSSKHWACAEIWWWKKSKAHQN